MTTLVTGGAGFIGSHLVHQLVDRGERLRVLELPSADVAHLPTDKLEIVRGDIRDRASVRRAVDGCRTVYHLAANPNLWTARRGDFLRVNYWGTVHVLEEALRSGAERVLHTSTESILTPAVRPPVGLISPEIRVTLPEAIGPYCRSKLRAEQFARRLARQGYPVVIANPTVPVGPGDRGLSPPSRLIVAFCRGALPAYVDSQLNLIDVRDAAAGLIGVMERGTPGRRHLLGAENLTIGTLLAILSRLTGRPVPAWKVPYPIALAVAGMSEWLANVVTHRPPTATLTGVRLTRRTMHFDVQPGLDQLGLTPRPIEAALEDAIDWFTARGWIPPGSHRLPGQR